MARKQREAAVAPTYDAVSPANKLVLPANDMRQPGGFFSRIWHWVVSECEDLLPPKTMEKASRKILW